MLAKNARNSVLLVPDGEIAGLEQQRLRFDVVHVDGVDAETCQSLDKERERAGLEPSGAELATGEQQEDVEGIIYPFISPLVVAVIPLAAAVQRLPTDPDMR